MGIVGTVDSAYKALLAAVPELDDAAMTATGEMALDSGVPVVFAGFGSSAGVRCPAPGTRAMENASMRRGRWRCEAMGEERHETQARAAARAGGCGRGVLEAREEILDGERRGLEGGRLA